MSNPAGKPGNNATMRMGLSDSMDMRNLLYAISEEFPLVISVNLTQNTYKMLEYENYKTQKAAAGGVFDDLIEVGASTVDPMHRQLFIDAFSRRSLLAAYAEGRKKVELDVRQLRDNGQYGWVKTTVIFLTNEENDEVLEITLAQPIEEEKEKVPTERGRPGRAACSDGHRPGRLQARERQLGAQDRRHGAGRLCRHAQRVFPRLRRHRPRGRRRVRSVHEICRVAQSGDGQRL